MSIFISTAATGNISTVETAAACGPWGGETGIFYIYKRESVL